jgi:uncharacterized protein (TIRG00374 family)
MNKRRIFWFLHFLGPILFIIFITRVIDFKQYLKILSGADPVLILASFLFFPVIISIRTLRWRMICQPFNVLYSFRESLELYYIGWFLGAFIPQGMGTFTKTIYLKKDGYTLGKSVLTILLDKVFDLFGLLIFGSLGLIYFARLLPNKNVFLALPLILIMALVLILYRKKVLLLFKNFLNSYLIKKLARWGKFSVDNVDSYSQKIGSQKIWVLMGLSISIAFLRSTSMYILAMSLHLDASFLFILACRSLVGMALVLPISFMGLGARDSVLLYCFTAVGKPAEAAISLGILAFLWTVFFRLLGVIFWIKYSVTKLGEEAE